MPADVSESPAASKERAEREMQGHRERGEAPQVNKDVEKEEKLLKFDNEADNAGVGGGGDAAAFNQHLRERESGGAGAYGEYESEVKDNEAEESSSLEVPGDADGTDGAKHDSAASSPNKPQQLDLESSTNH